MTQAMLAEHCGVSKSYISQIEAGERDPTVKVLSDIAYALGVSLDDLV